MDSSISARIAAAIDPSDATPLYHQLAEVVRWEISRGRLAIGEVLPPIREVAEAVGVNYHTVRRAWGDLEAEGVLDQRRGRGARVIRAPARGGWTPAGSSSSGGGADHPRVWVVAGSLEGGAGLAQAISDRWSVEAIPWPLGAEAPPPGVVICTVEVEGTLLAAWPTREGDLRALATTLDQAALGVLRRNAALLGVSEVRIHADPADPTARELRRQLPRLGLRAVLVTGDGARADHGTRGEALQLYFPAAWTGLEWSARSQPHAVMAHMDWAAGPLAGVAREQGWQGR